MDSIYKKYEEKLDNIKNIINEVGSCYSFKSSFNSKDIDRLKTFFDIEEVFLDEDDFETIENFEDEVECYYFLFRKKDNKNKSLIKD